MAKYQATEASSMEAGGGSGFRIAKDGERVRVVFLYAGPESIDGWSCHRFARLSGYTEVMDCPRSPKDPMEMCPACKDGQTLYTRVFVRMLNLNTNEVTVWDRASSFRRDLTGFMEYFNPLYSKVYEITRRGTGLQTQYQFQSLGDSGITPEQYEEYVKQADEKAAELVRPAEQYLAIKTAWENSLKNQDTVQVQSNQAANAGAWGAPQQAAPQQGQWGAPPQAQWNPNPNPNPQPTQPAPQQWGQPNQAPQAPAQNGWPQAAPQAPAQGGQGQAPQAWGQAPQQWGQNG